MNAKAIIQQAHPIPKPVNYFTIEPPVFLWRWMQKTGCTINYFSPMDVNRSWHTQTIAYNQNSLIDRVLFFSCWKDVFFCLFLNFLTNSPRELVMGKVELLFMLPSHWRLRGLSSGVVHMTCTTVWYWIQWQIYAWFYARVFRKGPQQLPWYSIIRWITGTLSQPNMALAHLAI